MTTLDVFVWAVLPYICLVVFIVGLIWRWRTDQFGWTSRSSQLYESRILRWGSPLFHLGILMVLAGHVMGLLVPKSWTDAVGISQHAYHLVATVAGSIAAIMTITGFILLMIRRFKTPSVRRKTTRNDKIMLIFLAIPMFLGAFATFHNQVFGREGGYDYRVTIAPWLRSLFMGSPDVQLMASVPMDFKLHVVAGMLLIAMVPFTRLVHMFSAPVGYVTRPYVVYRSRKSSVSTAPPARGWEPVHTVDSPEGEGSFGA